jgi:NAD-dependent SIR2 family protein deacetylase
MLSFKKILKPSNSLFFVTGAGISKSAPSNLPTGIDFINSFFEYIKTAEIDSKFNALIKKLKNNPSIRFEILLSLINREFNVDSKQILECYKNCKSYNKIHYLLAILTRYKHIISTTNFDSLIERAYQDLFNKNLDVVINDSEYSSNLYGTHTLYKLHGSFEIFNRNTKTWEEQSESILHTIDLIGLQGYKLRLNINKQKFLIENFVKRDVIFIGYSGSDDFDIIPIIKMTKSNRKLIWFDYNENINSISSGKQICDKPEKFGKIGYFITELIQNNIRTPDNCYIVRSNLFDFMISIFSSLDLKPIENFVVSNNDFIINSSKYFNKKFNQILPDSISIRRIKALLYFNCGLYGESLNIYLKLKQSIKYENDPYLYSKVYYKSALCYLNIEPKELNLALEYAKISYTIDEKNSFRSILLSVILLVRIYREIGDVARAKRYYEIIENSLVDSNDRFIIYQYAIFYHEYSKMLFIYKNPNSIEICEKSIQLFTKLGMLDGIMTSSITLSSVLMENNNINKSISVLNEIKSIALNIGDNKNLCSIYNELGIAYRYKKEYSLSIENHNKAISFAKILNNKEEIARQYYNIALTEKDNGHIKTAKKYHNKNLKRINNLEDSLIKKKLLAEHYQLNGHFFFLKKKYFKTKQSIIRSTIIAKKIDYHDVIIKNDQFLTLIEMNNILDK